LQQHLWSIDGIHLNQITLKFVGISAFLQLEGFDLSRGPVLECDHYVGVGFVNGEGDDSVDGALEVDIVLIFVGQIHPAPGFLLDPRDVEGVLGRYGFITVHLQNNNEYDY
jgi:hypothetical protein